MRFIPVILASLLSACASVDGLSGLDIDEATLQSVAKSQLQSRMGADGALPLVNTAIMDISLLLEDVDLDLVAADGGAVVAGFESTLNTTVPLIGTVKTRLAPRFQAGLMIKDEAIYLTSPKLLSLGLSEGYDQKIDQFLGDNGNALTQALDAYFSSQPIYRLDSDPRTRLAAKLLTNLRIGDDRVSLVP